MKLRQVIDILMVVIMPLLMAYSLIGDFFHEIAGIVMMCLFITHLCLNRKWLFNIFKGRYSPRRTVQTVINLLLILFMLLQPISGILMSKYVLKEVTLPGISSLVRTVHLALAYWGYCLISIHAGMHIESVMLKAKRKKKSTYDVLNVLMWVVAVYGCYAFIKRGFPGYMFLQNAFVFIDFSEPIVFFIADYLAILILFENIGRLLSKLK